MKVLLLDNYAAVLGIGTKQVYSTMFLQLPQKRVYFKVIESLMKKVIKEEQQSMLN